MVKLMLYRRLLGVRIPHLLPFLALLFIKICQYSKYELLEN